MNLRPRSTTKEPVPKQPPQEPDPEQIARIAYANWLARGCPPGSPELDWHKAEEEWKALIANHPVNH